MGCQTIVQCFALEAKNLPSGFWYRQLRQLALKSRERGEGALDFGNDEVKGRSLVAPVGEEPEEVDPAEGGVLKARGGQGLLEFG